MPLASLARELSVWGASSVPPSRWETCTLEGVRPFVSSGFTTVSVVSRAWATLALVVSLWLAVPSRPALAGCERLGVRTDTSEIEERARRLTLAPEEVAERTDFIVESL